MKPKGPNLYIIRILARKLEILISGKHNKITIK